MSLLAGTRKVLAGGGTLRTRLVLLIAVTCGLGLLIEAGALAAYEHLRVREDEVRDLTTLARVVADRSAAALVFGDDRVATAMLHALHGKPEVSDACIYATGEPVFARYRRAPDGDWSCPQPVTAEPGVHEEDGHLLVVEPVSEDGARVGVLVVRASLDAANALWRRDLLVTALITLLTSLVAGLVGYRWLRSVSQPIEQLTETVRSIASSRNYALRAQAGGADETSTLVAGFNDMLQVIEANSEAVLASNRRLTDNENQLKALNETLEQRVVERTRDLRDANQQVARQAALLEALLDTIPNPVFYKGADTRFLGCNRAYEEAFGVARARFVGRRVLDLEYLPEADRRAYQAEDEAVIADVGRVVREQRLTFADGRTVDTLYSVSGFRGPDGAPGGLIGLIVDITELKEAQRHAQQAQGEAEAASRMKSDFLATMSHEIRTPMNAIIGMLYLAQESELPAAPRSYLAKAQSAAHSLLGIINDILDFSKIEAGKLAIASVEFALDAVIEQVKDALGLEAQRKDVEFLLRHEVNIPPILVGDPLRVGQILLNLCNNAIKFTERGEVELALSCTPSGDDHLELLISVRDTGIGISPEQAGRLFQKFSQADQTATRRHGGTGLGLAISRQLAEMMGGSLWLASSQPGKGSTFCCRLRLGRVAAGAATVPDRMAQPGRLLAGVRALVVDDNAAAREILADALRAFGVDVTLASSGASALETLRGAEPAGYDLVLMDWHMPPMNGDEVIRRIRASSGISNQPRIVMVTAYGREDVARAALQAEVAGLLVKPVAPSVLLDTVMVALGRERVAGAQAAAGPYRHALGDLGGARLLLVEDNEVNREFALALLTRMNAEVDCAHDGAEALAMVQQSRYAAVLMDINMPVMDGLEATRRIRALAESPGSAHLASLPIVAMTAQAMADDERRSLAAGMNAHLVKPIEPEHLLTVLAGQLGLRTPQPRPAAGTAVVLAPDLAALGTVDAARGVARIGGSSDAYRAQLLRFARNYLDAGERLEGLVASGRLADAGELCHALKGVCGNLCAEPLFALLAELDTQLRRGETPPPVQRQRFGELLAALLAEIAHLRDGVPTPPDSGAGEDTPDLAGNARKLIDLLASDLGAVAPVLARLRAGSAGTALSRMVDDISHHIDNFDIDRAVSLLKGIANSPDNQP